MEILRGRVHRFGRNANELFAHQQVDATSPLFVVGNEYVGHDKRIEAVFVCLGIDPITAIWHEAAGHRPPYVSLLGTGLFDQVREDLGGLLFGVRVGQLKFGARAFEALQMVFKAEKITFADTYYIVASIRLGKAQVGHRDCRVIQIHVSAIDECRAVAVLMLIGDAHMGGVVQHDVLCLDDAHRSLSIPR
ncbi:hypothetical protein D3C84_782500 [compost metagenome]